MRPGCLCAGLVGVVGGVGEGGAGRFVCKRPLVILESVLIASQGVRLTMAGPGQRRKTGAGSVRDRVPGRRCVRARACADCAGGPGRGPCGPGPGVMDGRDAMEGAHTVLRVERGRAGAEELAAVTAVLLALRAQGQAHGEPQDGLPGGAPEGPPAPERAWWAPVQDFTAPGSWR
ncbi:hypothetical protein GCM10010335_59330 [Streptomyces galbus]|nr:hypothetical protein GCM10010335_59330 [Streptomyces galbus]